MSDPFENCAVIKVVRLFSENSSDPDELYPFPFFGDSERLREHYAQYGSKPLLIDNPAFSQEAIEMIRWYLTPSKDLLSSSPSPSPSPSPPPSPLSTSLLSLSTALSTSLSTSSSSSSSSSPSSSSSSSSSYSSSSTSNCRQSSSPPKTQEEIFDYLNLQSGTADGYLIQNLVVVADELILPSLSAWAQSVLRKALIRSQTPLQLRKKLKLIDTCPQKYKSREERIWNGNKVVEDPSGGDKLKLAIALQLSELNDAELSTGFDLGFEMEDPPKRKPQSDHIVKRCSARGCSVVFGLLYGRHHCRKCANIFCEFHANIFVRLPESEKIEPESVGYISSWYTYARTFGDSSLSRICNGCYDQVEEEKRCRSAFSAFQIMGLEIPLLNRALVISSSWHQAAQKCFGILANVQYKLPEERMDRIERNLLWNNRDFFVGHPRWLLQLIRIADLTNTDVAEEMHQLLLKKKRTIKCSAAMCHRQFNLERDGSFNIRLQLCKGGFTPHSLIQLLKENIAYPPIRQFAAESLLSRLIPGNPKEFRLYLPILVEMLRYEALPDPSPLFKTLLEASVSDPEIRYDFFWAMNLRAFSDSPYAGRYESLKQHFMVSLALRCGEKVVLQLTEAFCIYWVFRSIPQNTPVEEIKERLRVSLRPYQTQRTPCLFDPTHMVTFYHIDDVKVLSSATQPVVIPVTIECRDCEETCKYRKKTATSGAKTTTSVAKTTITKKGEKSGKVKRILGRAPEKNKRHMMFKYEDVRRDYLVLKIIEMMDLTLRRGVDGYDTECVTYQVIPTSIHDGFVEFVEGALTIFDVKIDDNQNQRTIQKWLFDQNEISGQNYQSIRKVFLNTLSFWSVATLLLGVGDRHSCNIMIKPSGALFHIDYGYILGEDPKKPFAPLMRITNDMLNVFGGSNSEFESACWEIYSKLREDSLLFLDLCSVNFMWDPTLDGGPPISENYKNYLMGDLYQRFSLMSHSGKAATNLKNWIEESAANPLPDVFDFFRKIFGKATKTTKQNDPKEEEQQEESEGENSLSSLSRDEENDSWWFWSLQKYYKG